MTIRFSLLAVEYRRSEHERLHLMSKLARFYSFDAQEVVTGLQPCKLTRDRWQRLGT